MLRGLFPNRHARRFGLSVVAIGLVMPATVNAQQVHAGKAGVSVRPSLLRAADARANVPATTRPANPLGVTIASAVLPGAGQLMLRQRRGVAYVAIEAAALAFYVSQTRDGRRQRERYRSISRDVARADFNPNGPRGDWDYYELMEKYVSSGEFDAVPGGTIQPEMDEETFNGSVWLLARRTYWRDADVAPDPASPEYSAAMRFYENRAVPHDMRWTWIGDPAAYQQFRSAISGSNSAFRSAGQTASLILANHFLSAVDAYVSAQIRLRRHSDQSVYAIVSVPLRY